MPLYAYKCQSCDDTFEARRSFAEAAQPAPCPICAGDDTRKLLSRINVGGFAQPAKKSFSLPMKQGRCCGPTGCSCH